MHSIARSVEDFARRVGGILAALLPVRYWSALDTYMPVTSSAVLSSILTFLAGTAIGIPGFIGHATAMASASNEVMLKAATGPQGGGVTTAMPVGMTGLSLFTFLLMTPGGWATLYLCGTGFLRALSAVCHDPRGDVILSLIDSAAAGTRRNVKVRRADSRRLALEGPEVPDRIVRGSQIGLPDAELVIISSRRKPGWDAGTVAITGQTAYRVGPIVERQINGRLRTLYPLREHNDLEVFRRIVRYELPQEAVTRARAPDTSSGR